MGFSSFLCCKSKQSIPAYPYADLPAVLSHVRIIFPDESFIEGTYDGYGRIHARDDFQAYCNKETSKEYHEDQENAYFYWDELEKRGFLTSESSWDDLYTKMKIVRMLDYNGEKFADLAKLESCEEQGYFYSRATRAKLIESIQPKGKK